jgi:competence protein ComGC
MDNNINNENEPKDKIIDISADSIQVTDLPKQKKKKKKKKHSFTFKMVVTMLIIFALLVIVPFLTPLLNSIKYVGSAKEVLDTLESRYPDTKFEITSKDSKHDDGVIYTVEATKKNDTSEKYTVEAVYYTGGWSYSEAILDNYYLIGTGKLDTIMEMAQSLLPDAEVKLDDSQSFRGDDREACEYYKNTWLKLNCYVDSNTYTDELSEQVSNFIEQFTSRELWNQYEIFKSDNETYSSLFKGITLSMYSKETGEYLGGWSTERDWSTHCYVGRVTDISQYIHKYTTDTESE